MRVALVVCACALAACGGVVSGPVPRPLVTATRESAGDTLSVQLERLVQRLQGRVTRTAFEERAFLATRENQTWPVEIPAGQCWTLVEFSSVGLQDVDATLFAPSGDIIARDVEPDAHPTIQVCAPADALRRAFYSLSAYEGAGAVLVVGLLSAADQFGPIARQVGGRPGTESASVAGPSVGGTDPRVDAFVQGAGRRNFEPIGQTLSVDLQQTQTVDMPLPIESGYCYTVAAFAFGALSNLDIELRDGDAVRAVDGSLEKDAFAQWCPGNAQAASIRLIAQSGNGTARIMVLRASESEVGGAAGLWLGRLAEAEPERDPVEAVADRGRTWLLGRGARDVRRLLRGRLSNGEVQRHALRLSRGCYAVQVALGRGLGEPDWTLLGESASFVSKDTAEVCLSESREVTLDLAAKTGTGEFIVQVAKTASVNR